MSSSSRRRQAKRRKLIALVVGAVVAFTGVGAVVAVGLDHPEPAPVSSKVADYYSNNATLAPNTPPSPVTLESAFSTLSASLSAFTLGDVKAKLASGNNLTISVLGDSTGNSGGEWVDLWAQHLSAKGSVIIHIWDEVAEDWNPQPVTYGAGGRIIEIWNGSHPGASIDYGLDRLANLQPAQPDLVIFNYGHNQTKTKIDDGLIALSQDIDSKWSTKIPAVMTIQNPSLDVRAEGSSLSAKAIATLASSRGFPVVDVESAFAASGPLPSLLRDNVHPNDAGSRIWADAVITAIG